MWGGQPGYSGAASAHDPRRAFSTACALVLVFFGLPVFVEHTEVWARAFIATRYTAQWTNIGMGVYWVVMGLALLQFSRAFIWFGSGVLIAIAARMMARAQ